MYQVLSSTPLEAVDGHVDIDFRDTEGWTDLPDDGKIMPILFGDPDAGPFVVLSCFPPMEDQMPLSFAHSHATDNWRISVRGTTNMGKDAYAEGQFRFHDGGVPYASDNFAWGPDGGFGIIMFADRRGFAIKPVNGDIAAKVGPEQAASGEALGIDLQDPCPGAPAIATTWGSTRRAHLNEGFESAAGWPEVSPGLRLSVGLLGEPDVGPGMLFLDADAGAEVLPARSLATEVLLAVVGGSVTIAGDALDTGCVRLDESGVDTPAVVAGDAGAQVVAIVADRRALQEALDAGTFTCPGLAEMLPALRDQLAPVG